jgi:uncharacterized membrane protein
MLWDFGPAHCRTRVVTGVFEDSGVLTFHGLLASSSAYADSSTSTAARSVGRPHGGASGASDARTLCFLPFGWLGCGCVSSSYLPTGGF